MTPLIHFSIGFPDSFPGLQHPTGSLIWQGSLILATDVIAPYPAPWERNSMESPDGSRGLLWRENRWIPWSEIDLKQQTRGGPGGQHSNRSATAVEIRWSIRDSRALNEMEKALLFDQASTRLDRQGTLRIIASEERSAARNRERALERLAEWLEVSLRKKKKRTPTRPTSSSLRKRLDEKKRRSQVKKDRGKYRGDHH
jgi:ribosome-associated protein